MCVCTHVYPQRAAARTTRDIRDKPRFVLAAQALHPQPEVRGARKRRWPEESSENEVIQPVRGGCKTTPV